MTRSRGPDAIERLYARSTRRYEDGTPRTKHVMTNVMVDVADDGATASSRSYFTVLQAVPGALALQPVIAGRYRHAYERVDRTVASGDDAHHHRPRRRPGTPHALRPGAMKLSLVYGWECTPEAFWALYFDPDFAVRLHLECLGSTSAEVLSQEGDLTRRPGADPSLWPTTQHARTGAQDLRRRGRHHRGEHLRPDVSTTTFTMTPGTMADKTHIEGAIALTRESGSTVETLLARRPGQDLRGRTDRRALHRAPGP